MKLQDDKIQEAYNKMLKINEITGKKSGKFVLFTGDDGEKVAKELGHPVWGSIGVPLHMIKELEKKLKIKIEIK